jgi:uncharacterized membrane protein YfcA
MDPLIIVFGLGVGVLIGMTGIGGGSLMTPLLIIFAGIQPTVAIGTDLAYGAVTKTVGGWRHWRNHTVDFGVCWWLAAGSVPGALVGVWLLDRLHTALGSDFDQVLLACVAGALMVASLAILSRVLLMPNSAAGEREQVVMTGGRRAAAVVLGAFLGLILGLTSVGSGALIGPVLILVFHLRPHRVVGTDVFHAAVLLWVAGLAHWISGNVDFALMGNILIGSIPGVLIGSQLVMRVPAAGLRPVLGCVLLGSALGVLTKAGVDVPVAAIVGVPAAVGVLAWALARSRRESLPPPVAPTPERA